MDKPIINPRSLFLIDCFGAILSAFLLGVILVRFERVFGMPKETLFPLAVAACFFAMYSGWCFLRFPKNWKPYLRFIAIINIMYCTWTLFLVIQFEEKLTTLGIGYFVLEMILILGIAFLELKTSTK